jgi:DNA replication protein DnaC
MVVAGVSPDFDQHVEEARRPPVKKEPKRFDGGAIAAVNPGALVAPDTNPALIDAAVKYNAEVERRERERVELVLDRIAPLEQIDVEDALLWQGLDEDEDRSHRVTGMVWKVTGKCSSCGNPLTLLSETESGLDARLVAAGKVAQARTGVACDTCLLELEAAAERTQNDQKRRARVTASNLDKAMQGFEFSQMIAGDGRELTVGGARDWSTVEYPEPRGLYIYGDKGTGKTRLAATAAWQRLRQYHVTWVSWPILLAQLGAAFNDSARAEAISVLTGKGALILDDIAQEKDEKVSDWARRQLFAAVDRRIQAGAPLLITANLDPEQIGHVLGDKLVSRLVGYSRVLKFHGRDMRLEFNFDGSKRKGEVS